MLVRHPDWPAALARFFAAREGAEFGYGRSDCCLFVADAVLAMTGVDLAADYRGRYRSREGAEECLRLTAGRATVAAAMERAARGLGLAEVPVACAQRGDIVLLAREAGDQSLGLVALDGRRIAAVSERGFLYLPVGRAARAWRI